MISYNSSQIGSSYNWYKKYPAKYLNVKQFVIKIDQKK